MPDLHSHDGLYGAKVKPRAKELGAKRRSEFVQEPLFAFSGFVLATITLAAVQASFSDLSLQRPEHVTIRLAVFAEDQRATCCMFLFVFQQPNH